MSTAWKDIWKVYQNQFNIKPVAYSAIQLRMKKLSMKKILLYLFTQPA